MKGDVQVLKGTDPGEILLALASQMPEAVGFSHRATGTTSRDGSGMEVVDSITAVHGADIVSDPATTAGLFEALTESKGGRMKTFKEVTPESIVEARQRIFGQPLGPAPKPGETFTEVTDDSIMAARKRLLV